MPLLTELGMVWWTWLYKEVAPSGLGRWMFSAEFRVQSAKNLLGEILTPSVVPGCGRRLGATAHGRGRSAVTWTRLNPTSEEHHRCRARSSRLSRKRVVRAAYPWPPNGR